MGLVFGVEVGEPFHTRAPILLVGERVRHGGAFLCWPHRNVSAWFLVQLGSFPPDRSPRNHA